MVSPSSIIGTPEEWHYYLSVKCEPLKLKRTLLSKYRTHNEKSQIIHSIPECAAMNSTQIRQIESRLEDAGLAGLAQVLRNRSYSLLDNNKRQNRRWAHRAVVLDIEARWIVQRQAYVQEEAQALSRALMLSEDKEQQSFPELQAYEDELEELNSLYWRYTRLHGALDGDIPLGIFNRAFRQHRKKPDWYLSKELREDCVRRGGCCGRGCGCCEKDRGNNTRQLWKRGHCTSACGCCVRTRKSQQDVSVTMQKDMEDFPFDIVALATPYSERIYLAYIWGLKPADDH